MANKQTKRYSTILNKLLAKHTLLFLNETGGGSLFTKQLYLRVVYHNNKFNFILLI